MRPLLILPILVVACSAGPAFHPQGDHEEGHDVPCMVGGHVNAGWHACARSKVQACCPDGMSCGDDDFVASPGVCRSW